MFWKGKKERNLGFKIGLFLDIVAGGILLCAIFFVLHSVISKNGYKIEDLETVKGVFVKLEKRESTTYNSIAYHYDIWLDDNQKYTIPWDYVDCFAISLFNYRVQKGDEILLRLPKSRLIVVGVEKGNEVVMKWECCNASIEQSKMTMPIIFILGIGLIWYLRKKGLEKEGSYDSLWF